MFTENRGRLHSNSMNILKSTAVSEKLKKQMCDKKTVAKQSEIMYNNRGRMRLSDSFL